jgi:hyperosmotically inducible periplasmic protein
MSRTTKAICTVALAAMLVAPGCMTTRSPSKQVDDAWITSKVESKLAADPEVNNFEIDVDTQDGVVRLSGNVEQEKARTEAEKLARNTEGVKSVNNEIQIGDPTFKENVTDAWIVTKIKSKLSASGDVNPFNVDVDAVEGVVTLSGIVKKEEAKREAERIARDTKGVKEVHNKIKVEAEKGEG